MPLWAALRRDRCDMHRVLEVNPCPLPIYICPGSGLKGRYASANSALMGARHRSRHGSTPNRIAMARMVVLRGLTTSEGIEWYGRHLGGTRMVRRFLAEEAARIQPVGPPRATDRTRRGPPNLV